MHEQRFGRRFCRETIRAALHRLKLSWKKAKKLLGRPGPTPSFPGRSRTDARWCRARPAPAGLCRRGAHPPGCRLPLVGARAWVCSTSPGLSAKRTFYGLYLYFYGLYLYNDGQVRLWPYPRGNGEHTIDVLGRLRAEFPERPLIVLASATTALKAGGGRVDDRVPAAAGLQPRLHAGRGAVAGAVALAARRRHLPALPRQP
jgi:hypothetical protein